MQSFETRREERARTVGDVKARMEEERDRLKLSGLDTRRLKLEHQEWETMVQETPQPSKSQSQRPENKKKREKPPPIIKSFKALNESDSDKNDKNTGGDITPYIRKPTRNSMTTHPPPE